VSSPWTWYQAFSWSKDFLENQKKKRNFMLRKLDLIISHHPQLQMLWQRGREIISISFCLLSTPEVQTRGNSVTPRELDDRYYSAVATSLRPNSSFWVPSWIPDLTI
jgi:hypothetical protein